MRGQVNGLPSILGAISGSPEGIQYFVSCPWVNISDRRLVCRFSSLFVG